MVMYTVRTCIFAEHFKQLHVHVVQCLVRGIGALCHAHIKSPVLISCIYSYASVLDGFYCTPQV